MKRTGKSKRNWRKGRTKRGRIGLKGEVEEAEGGRGG